MAQLEPQIPISTPKVRLTRKEYFLAFLLASVPFWVGLGVFMDNPAYISPMLLHGPTQPLGWMITSIVVVLTGLAYLSLLRGLALLKSEQSILPSALITGVYMILVLPAVFLVVLGPAGLILKETFF